MARKPRFYLPDVPAHVMQRGHNRDAIFFKDADYVVYLKIFRRVAEQFECQVHAYVLMTNHVHFLLTPAHSDSISLLFKALGAEYVRYVNKTYRRSGTLWGGRHKGCIIDSSNYFLRCMQYIELNPIRAGMVGDPSHYAWSSYKANAEGAASVILTPHVEYLSLAKEKDARVSLYCQLLATQMTTNCVQSIDDCLQSGTPLGGIQFINSIEKMLNFSVGRVKRGRPKKERNSAILS